MGGGEGLTVGVGWLVVEGRGGRDLCIFFLPRRWGVVPCALSERDAWGCVIGDHSTVFFYGWGLSFWSLVFGIWKTLAGFDCFVFGQDGNTPSQGNE